jgi:phosphatidylglycerophosphate synthase
MRQSPPRLSDIAATQMAGAGRVIRDAIIYLPDATSREAAGLPVGGRPLVVRTLIAAIRAGISRVGVPSSLRLPAVEAARQASAELARPIVWLTPETPPWLGEPVLLLPATTLVDPSSLRTLLAAPSAAGANVLDESKGAAPVAVVGPEVVAGLWTRLASGERLGGELDGSLRGDGTLVAADAFLLPVSNARLAHEAEEALYGRLGIDADSWVDRTFHRRFSRLLTRRLVGTPVTPNQVTIASLLVGLTAAACVWNASAAGLALIGLVLYAVSVIIDHTDGELARLTLQESVVGERLDFLSDTTVHALLVVGMGVAAERRFGGGALVMGLVAGAGVTLSAVFARRLPAARGGVQRAIKRFGSRDLFYLLLLLFVGGLAAVPAILPAVLGLAAVGSQAYWLGALAARLRSRQPIR